MTNHLDYLSEGLDAAIMEICDAVLRECGAADPVYAEHYKELTILEAEFNDVLEGEGVIEISGSRRDALKAYIRFLKFVHQRGMIRVYMAGVADRAAVRHMLRPLLDEE